MLWPGIRGCRWNQANLSAKIVWLIKEICVVKSSDLALLPRRNAIMKYGLGVLLQIISLAMLPSIIIFQLFYGFKLIVMPISLLCGICIFSLGTALRESQ